MAAEAAVWSQTAEIFLAQIIGIHIGRIVSVDDADTHAAFDTCIDLFDAAIFAADAGIFFILQIKFGKLTGPEPSLPLKLLSLLFYPLIAS